VNLKSTNPPLARVLGAGIFGLILAAGLLAVGRIHAAPAVFANQAPAPALTTQWQQDQPNEMDVFVPFGNAAENSLPQIFIYGPLKVRPHFDYRFLSGSGIQSSVGNQQNTVIQEISPGLLLDLGSHWAVDYTPTIRLYSDSQFQDGVDHSIQLTGGARYEDWIFSLSQGSQFTSAPLAETGTQTEQQTHTTTLTAGRALNSKMSLDLDVNQNIDLASGYQNTYDWSGLVWLNYEFWPRLNAGIGGGGGYTKVSIGTDQPYEELNARVNWRATDKISFQLSGGVQDRQYLNVAPETYPSITISPAGTNISLVTINPASYVLTPTFSASIQYLPFKDTQVTLNASRSISPSVIPGADTTGTLFGANVNQVLFKKFQLNFGAAYNIADYTETGLGLNVLPNNTLQLSLDSVGRTDDTISFNVRLSHPFFKRGTWSVFYQYSDNQSSQSGFSYTSNQMGFEVSYSY